jgi:DNA-binding MarR family transcriptional regulator
MTTREKMIEDLVQSTHAMRHKLMGKYSIQKEMEITPSQGLVLRLVASEEALNTKTIAQKLNISSSAATQLVDALVEKGSLVRKESSNDRRIVTLSLSAKAKKLFEEFKQQSLQEVKVLFDVFTDDELLQFVNLNKKIINGVLNK